MRAAPAVTASLDGCWPERVLIALLYALTGAALAAWAAAHGQFAAMAVVPTWAAAGALLSGLIGAGLARHLLPGDAAELGWDGAAWSLRRQQVQGGAADRCPLLALAVMIDLGVWLLLQAREGGAARGATWLVLRQRQVGASWHLLRVALQAHAGSAQAPAKPGGPA